MRKKQIRLVFVGFFLSIISIGQNLVFNPNFDEHTHCPKLNEREFACIYWSPSPTDWSTPDYYNRCSIDSNLMIPYNVTGYCQPRTGNAYIGIVLICYEDGYMEHICGRLKEPLKANYKYEVSFYAKLAYEYSDYSAYNIGAYLSKDSNIINAADYLDGMNSELEASVTNANGSFIKDTNWVKISGVYYAHGGERYITLGLFWDSNPEMVKLWNEYYGKKIALGNTKFNKGIKRYMLSPNVFEEKKYIDCKFKMNSHQAYYYLDNISVTPLFSPN